MKLQDAYAGESNQLGSWSLIGYSGPGTVVSGATDTTTTNNFEYGGGSLHGTGATGASVAINATSGAASTIGWVARSRVALNDVPTSTSVWTIAVGANANGVVSYTAEIPTNAEKLTPNFKQLSH